MRLLEFITGALLLPALIKGQCNPPHPCPEIPYGVNRFCRYFDGERTIPGREQSFNIYDRNWSNEDQTGEKCGEGLLRNLREERDCAVRMWDCQPTTGPNGEHGIYVQFSLFPWRHRYRWKNVETAYSKASERSDNETKLIRCCDYKDQACLDAAPGHDEANATSLFELLD